MPTSLILFIALLVAAGGLIVYFLIGHFKPAPAVPNPDLPSATASQRVMVTYLSAAFIGILFAMWASFTLPTTMVNAVAVPGLLAAIAPSIAGVIYLLIAAIGELSWPSPKGTTREASLQRRPLIASASPLHTRAMWIWAAVLAACLTAFGFAAAPDGRSLTHADGAGGSGPFPGWSYGIAMIIAAAALIAVTLGVLHLIARRPAVHGTSATNDTALRVRAATHALKGTQLSLAISLSGTLLVAAIAANNSGYWWSIVALIGGILALIGGIALTFWRAT